jgi:hypothetical protein
MDSRRQTPCPFHGTVLDSPDTRRPRANHTHARDRTGARGFGNAA